MRGSASQSSILLFADLEKEKHVKYAILDWLNAQRGTRAWIRNVGGVKAQYNGKDRFVAFGKRGQSDIWGITTGGRHFEVETKKRGARTAKQRQQEQLGWLQECAKLGAFCFMADDLDSFIEEWHKAGL